MQSYDKRIVTDIFLKKKRIKLILLVLFSQLKKIVLILPYGNVMIFVLVIRLSHLDLMGNDLPHFFLPIYEQYS